MVVNQNDVVIKIRVEMLQALQKIKEFQAKNAAAFKDIARLQKHNTTLATKEIGKLRTSIRYNYKQIAKYQEVVRGSSNKLNKSLGQSPFAGWAMSIMFAGMALQRFSMSIYKFGTKAFQEISHSVEGTVTNVDMLQGSMKYLGFTIGQALEPTLSYLIPIVDRISDWVEANPKLVATLTTLGIVLGTVFMVGGMAKLALNGFLDMGSKIILLFPAIKAAIAGLSAAIGAPILAVIGLILLALAVLYAMWKTNFGGMRDFFKNTFGILWETIKMIFGDIFKIIKTVIEIIVAIFEGNWDKVGELTWKLLKQLAALFLKALTGIGAIILNVLVFAWNLVVDIILKIVVGLVNAIARLFINSWIKTLDFMGKMSEKLGLGRGMFDSAINSLNNFSEKLSVADSKVKEFADKIKGGYISSADIKTSFEGVDSALGLTKVDNAPLSSGISSPTSNTYIQQVVIENKDTTLFNELISGIGVGQ
jgi:methyl-accepting chemotaxis protein